jgi:hypothetical protein
MAEPPTGDWARLVNAYQREGIFLVLGAGVSYKSGLPNWSQLLRGVYRHQEQHRKSLPKGLEQLPAPVLASLLEEDAGSRGKFVEDVRDILWKKFPLRHLTPIDADTASDFATQMDAQNPTLRAISAICTMLTEKRRFRPNPHVQAVVTFNLDNLLQLHSRAKYGEWSSRHPSRSFILRSVERPSAGSVRTKTPVYHLHGMIRIDKEINQTEKHAPDLMVLTEQDFFDTFNKPTQASNYVFLHLLREHTAIFVGLSMQDENLRRLLHYSKMERVRSYATEHPEETDDQLSARARRHVALLVRDEDKEVNRAREATLSPLGVRVLWLTGHEEIPSRLSGLYESTAGLQWADVYEPAP